MVEAAGTGERADGLDEVFAQRAADAAVGELDEAVLAAGEVAFAGDECGVDVDFGEVVDDDRDALAMAVGEDVVEEGGFAGAEEAGEDGDGGLAGLGGLDFAGLDFAGASSANRSCR